MDSYKILVDIQIKILKVLQFFLKLNFKLNLIPPI